VTDTETAAAIEALAYRIRERDADPERSDADVFALEFMTALRGRGWRPTAARTEQPPLHAAPVPDRRSRDEELAAARADLAALAAAREAEEGAA
jgi:hypothetical protein